MFENPPSKLTLSRINEAGSDVMKAVPTCQVAFTNIITFIQTFLFQLCAVMDSLTILSLFFTLSEIIIVVAAC